jgi:hypothetical protein
MRESTGDSEALLEAFCLATVVSPRRRHPEVERFARLDNYYPRGVTSALVAHGTVPVDGRLPSVAIATELRDVEFQCTGSV